MYSKELDQVRIAMLSDKNNAFIGSLLLSMNFEWDNNISTAATDGDTVFFNREFFGELSKEERIGVYRHEVTKPYQRAGRPDSGLGKPCGTRAGKAWTAKGVTKSSGYPNGMDRKNFLPMNQQHGFAAITFFRGFAANGLIVKEHGASTACGAV